MALVRGNANYRRYDWMGSDKTESSFQNTMLMRDGGDASSAAALKRRTREQRTRVVREARCYLDHLRKEILQNDKDAEITGMPKSGYKYEGGSDENESDKASMNLSCLVRGSRYRSGINLSSPFDGTSHGKVSTLQRYNAHCRQILTDLIEEHKKTLGEKSEAGEQLTQQEYAVLDEVNRIELPDEEATALSEDDLATLAKEEETEAVHDEKKAVCELYNATTMEKAKEMLSFALVRNANLYASFREISLSCSTSMIMQSPAREERDEDANQQNGNSEKQQNGDAASEGENDELDATKAGGDAENQEAEQNGENNAETNGDENQTVEN